MGVCVPEELGGAGADFLSYILVLEELSRADAGVGVTVAVHTSAVTLPILAFGTDEQQRAVRARRSRAGACSAPSRSPSPSRARTPGALRSAADARRRRLAARAARSSGSRTAATRGTFLVFARTDPADRRARAASARSSRRRPTSRSRARRRSSASTRPRRPTSASTGRRVGPRPAAARGEPRLHGRDGRRSTAGGSGSPRRRSGSRRPPTTWRARYALERHQFGSRIADFQAIQFKLADMATEIDAARVLTYRAAWLKQAGPAAHRRGRKGEAVRLVGVARRQTGEAIQVLGGYGYTTRVPGRALLPRREDHRDLRGHERDPADRDRPRRSSPQHEGRVAARAG